MLPLPSLFTPSAARRGCAALLAAGTCVTLGACTAPSNPQSKELDGEAGKVQAVVAEFATFAKDDNAKAICTSLLTPAAVKAVAGGGDCEKRVDTLIDATDATALDVGSVKVTGLMAVASIRLPKDRSQTSGQSKILLERAAPNGAWKIAAFGNAASDAAAATTPATTPGTSPSATTP